MDAAATRSCGECTMCCKLLDVVALAKPAGTWCPHCAPGRGCGVYDTRPGECRSFQCGWLVDPKLGEEWRPSRSRIMLVSEAGSNRLAAHVDPARADAWRRAPFYTALKRWAQAAARQRGQVVVYVGRQATVVLPDRDVPLGELSPHEAIATRERMTPGGLRWETFKVPRDAVPAPTDGAPRAAQS